MLSLRSREMKELLSYCYLNPAKTFYVNDMVKRLRLDKRNLVKKIHELQEQGLLRGEAQGNMKLYSLNKEYPLYNEYRTIVMKTVGLEHMLARSLKGLGIEKAYIYGSYAAHGLKEHSDIDLLIIGSFSIADVQKRLNALGNRIGREMNPVYMDAGEFQKRLKAKDPFLTRVMESPKIEVF